MNGKLFLALLIIATVGIMPVFSHVEDDTERAAVILMTDPDAGEAELYVEDVIEKSAGEAQAAAEANEEAVLAAEEAAEEEPDSISDNKYLRESRRHAELAQEYYAQGDYDAASHSAEESLWYSKMSDVFIAITTAKHRLDWAVSSGASGQYPAEYEEAVGWYEQSLAQRDEEDLDAALDSAHKVIDLMAYIGGGAPGSMPDGGYTLPATYTVRNWSSFKDCFWNIAAHPWVYGDPFKWKILYEANKSKLPKPNNPNLIEPGIVLDIPSIKGETRQGAWNASRTYKPFR